MNLVELRDFINTYFNDGELRDLCFDLGIDYESLGGDNKSAKARELVAHCQRRNRLAELEAICLRLRPDALGTPAPADRPSVNPAVNQSGGVTINAQIVNITGDVTGRDKKTSSNPDPDQAPPTTT